MLDNQLIRLLRDRIIQALDAAGWSEMMVIQKDQPTQQGIPYGPGVYFQKLFDYKFGWARSETTLAGESFDWKEDQLIETPFQIGALAIQDPLRVDLPTASDIVNYLAMWLNHRATVQFFMKYNVNILHVSDVRNMPFEDDRHRMEYHPSFDLVLTHNRTSTISIGGAGKVEDANVIVIGGKDTPQVTPPVHGIVGGA